MVSPFVYGCPYLGGEPMGPQDGCGGAGRGPSVMNGFCQLGVNIVEVAAPRDGRDGGKCRPESVCKLGVEQQLGAESGASQFLLSRTGWGSGET